jgi:hypothetical protein
LAEWTYNGFTKLGVRKTNANRLVNEENICVGVPRLRVKLGTIGIRDPARSFTKLRKFYRELQDEKTNLTRRRAQERMNIQVHH